jgi:hypothetical protein
MGAPRKPKVVQRVEVVCQTCGIIAELSPTRTGVRPKLCDCPTPQAVTPITTPRHCMRCNTPLNRYNKGSECGPCLLAREREKPRRV